MSIREYGGASVSLVWWCSGGGLVELEMHAIAMVAERLEIEERRYSNILGMRLVQVKDSKSDWILISWQGADWWRRKWG